jgi:methyl-accepting chemotaxis protein
MYNSKVQEISGAMSAVVTGKRALLYQYSQDKENTDIKQSLQDLFSDLFFQFPDGDLVLVDNELNVVVNRGYWGDFTVNDILLYGDVRDRIVEGSAPLVIERNDRVVFAHPYTIGAEKFATLIYVIKRDLILKNIFDSGVTMVISMFFILYILGFVLIGVLVDLVASPLRSVVVGIEKLTIGNFNYRVTEKHPDELGLLARSYNRLAEMLSALSQKATAEQDIQKTIELETQKYREHLERTLVQHTSINDLEKSELLGHIAIEQQRISSHNNTLADNIMFAAAAFLAHVYSKRFDLLIYNVSDTAEELKQSGVDSPAEHFDAATERFADDANRFLSISGNIRYLFTYNFEMFTFDVDDFSKRLINFLEYTSADVSIVVEVDEASERSFTGYERYYTRVVLLLSAFVSQQLIAQQVANPSLFIKLTVLGKRLRVIVQDNRLASGEDLASLQVSDVEEGLLYSFQTVLTRYRDSIVGKPASIGMRYSIEFNGALL